MTAFTVDYPNFRIFFPDETRNSLMSVYLDGTDLRDIRQNANQHIDMQFVNVHSMVLHDEILYFTNGKQVNFEEYDRDREQYVHNKLYIIGQDFAGLNIWHSSSQPRPGEFYLTLNPDLVSFIWLSTQTWWVLSDSQPRPGEFYLTLNPDLVSFIWLSTQTWWVLSDSQPRPDEFYLTLNPDLVSFIWLNPDLVSFIWLSTQTWWVLFDSQPRPGEFYLTVNYVLIFFLENVIVKINWVIELGNMNIWICLYFYNI